MIISLSSLIVFLGYDILKMLLSYLLMAYVMLSINVYKDVCSLPHFALKFIWYSNYPADPLKHSTDPWESVDHTLRNTELGPCF